MDRFTSPSVASVRFVAQRGILKPVVWRLVRVTTVGKDAIKHLDAPYIAVANHSSHLDAPLIIAGLPRRLSRYLAAGAAADYFFDVQWRKWLTTLFFNAFAIERNSEGKRSGSSRALLERQVPLLIFPEGGRSKYGEMGSFQAGRRCPRHCHQGAVPADRPCRGECGNAARRQLATARSPAGDHCVRRAHAARTRRNCGAVLLTTLRRGPSPA